jgi:hypothetical protein
VLVGGLTLHAHDEESLLASAVHPAGALKGARLPL